MASEAKAAMKKEQQESPESEQIEVAPATLSDMGGIAVETEEPSDDEDQREEDEEDEPESTELAEIIPTVPARIAGKKTAERTDDPVRMYLREMGSVELLSRAGEIAIAKRIEAGREAMIAGMCESPLTFGAITIWRDELNEGRVLLREIIDLEATYAGPDCKLMSAAVMHPEGHAIAHPAPVSATLGEPSVVPTAAPPAVPCAPTPTPPGAARTEGEQGDTGAAVAGQREFDDEDMENALSLAALEAKLKPKVVASFDHIADAYKRLRRLQDQDIEFKLKNSTLSPAQERRYKKLKDAIISEVKSVRLNQARIHSLVEQLYEINKRLVGYEGRLMLLAQSYGIAREDFLSVRLETC
jgi:RNA polymerase primary sigma factor